MLADDDSRHRYDSGALDDTFSLFDDNRLMSILKHGNNQSLKISELLRTLEDWRNRYNITVIKECDRSDYCSGEFRNIVLGYNAIHGYVSLLICLFGSLANVFNVAVLTRRDLAAAPINRLLKWLAVADVFVMIEYVPFSIYRYMLLPQQEERPYAWAVYMLFHMHFTQLLHTASILLTLSLAIWRYIAIKYPSYGPSLCTDRRCSLAIFLSFLLPPVLCIPSYFVSYNACPASSVVVTNGNVFTRKLTKRSKAEKRTDRTTKMLVAVLLLFLLTEFPQGILGLMSGALGRCFFKRCYDLFGELMDALALLNGAINFILYCSMSRQFRTTFGQLIRNRCTTTPRASSNTELQTTYV
ncbi:PREDICTED: probable G-protein coupled receptor 139 [Papilio polytes]|uniref:probable G-protein coupled receptor 139 n=1 Tax=Papilio polytes TaxID=76194 RepID=UPI000675F19E|nr:PREDICTED: probable G-protein coupled receptor 139 [Papilio polytes]